MGFIPRVTCRRCGRQYSSLRGRCPYCGTRRVKQSDRVPATSASTDPSTAAGERAASNARWQLIFGGILLLAVILAVVVLVSISLNGSTQPGPVATPPVNTNAPATPTPPPTPSPTATPTIESLTIYCNGEPAVEGGYVMDPRWNGTGQTLVISAVAFPQTVDISQDIVWSSSTESVITVTPTAGNPTTCTLTQVGTGTGITISCTVFGKTVTLPMNATDQNGVLG